MKHITPDMKLEENAERGINNPFGRNWCIMSPVTIELCNPLSLSFIHFYDGDKDCPNFHFVKIEKHWD